MSKENLYRGAAGGNPTQVSKLPKEPLDFEFPNTSPPPIRLRLATFIRQLFVVSGVAILLPLTLHFDVVIVGILVLCMALNYLVRTYKGIGPKVAARVSTAFLVTYFAYMFTYKVHGQIAGLMALVTFTYTAWIALQFRRHWVHRASCGMLTQQSVRAFRRSGQLPPGVKAKPWFPAFIQALQSWISYDPANSKIPGLMKSPAGDAQNRIAASFTLAILWAGLLVSPHSIALMNRVGNAVVLLPLLLFTVPVGFPLLLMCFVANECLGKAHALIDYQFEPINWTPFVEQMQASSNPIESKSVFLGRVHGDGSPILYPAERMMRGGWVQGSPGSGKTLYLMQLQEMLIELGYSVVVLDLKATSHELLYSAQAAAERVRKRTRREVPIYPFTPVNGEASFLLDVYSQEFWSARSPEEKAGIMLGFFGLNGGQVYGESYYRDSAWTVKQHLTAKYQDLASFHEAARRLAEELHHAKEWELSSQSKRDGEHPRLILNRLGMVDALNVRPTYSQGILDRAVKLDQLFETPSVLHCSLPAVTDPVGNPEIGRIILSSLLNAASYKQHRPVKCVVLVDEFQRMISRSLDLVLQQARSRGVGVILTNQSSADLQAVDRNMADTIMGNTAMQTWIKATDGIGVEQVRKFGGQYIDYLYSKSVSHSTNGSSSSLTTSEQILDRVSTGLIDRVNSSHDQYFLRLTDDGGYAAYGGEMFVAQMGYHTATEQEYIDRTLQPWPKAVPGMLVNGEHRPPTGPPNSSLLGPKKPKPSTNRRSTPLNP